MALDQENDPAHLPSHPPSPGLTPAGAARRRLAGLGASGVLMTLASNSAMATAEMVCKSPSGTLSGSLASRSPEPVACIGRSPGFWRNHESEWVGIRPGDRFCDHLYPGNDPAFGQVTCMGILIPKKYDKNKVARHIMATLLNVTSGKIGYLTEESVRAMWREYVTTGFYVPTAGATPWNGADLVLYLQSTQKGGDEEEQEEEDDGSGGGKGKGKGKGK